MDRSKRVGCLLCPFLVRRSLLQQTAMNSGDREPAVAVCKLSLVPPNSADSTWGLFAADTVIACTA